MIKARAKRLPISLSATRASNRDRTLLLRTDAPPADNHDNVAEPDQPVTVEVRSRLSRLIEVMRRRTEAMWLMKVAPESRDIHRPPLRVHGHGPHVVRIASTSRRSTS